MVVLFGCGKLVLDLFALIWIYFVVSVCVLIRLLLRWLVCRLVLLDVYCFTVKLIVLVSYVL